MTGAAKSTLSTLRDIVQSLLPAHDAQERVRHVLALLQQVLSCECCVLLEQPPDQPSRWLAIPEALPDQPTLRIELMRLLHRLQEQERPALIDYGRDVSGQLSWPSSLVVPLLRLEQVVGLIFVGHAVPSVYSDDDLSLLVVVAAQLAAYLTALHEVSERQRYIQRLELLRQVGHAARQMQMPGDFAQEALNRICRLLRCHAGRVLLYDFAAAEARAVALAIHGQTAALHPARISLASIPYLNVLRDGNVYLADSSADVDLSQVREAFQQERGAYLCAPLQVHGTLLGCLELLTDRPAAFAPEQVGPIREVADQLAIGLQQALLYEQVHSVEQDLQNLSRQMIEVQENERRYLALELHDEIGQALTGLKLMLEMIQRLPSDNLQRRLSEAQALVNELMARVRQLSLDLRPAMLDDLGLLPALLWHFERYTAQTSVQVTFAHTSLDRRFAPEIETAAYRIVQEALTNVARHSQVQHVTVLLWVADERLMVQIEDQGIGFYPALNQPVRSSHGLPGMRERAVLLGGEFIVETMPGAGTLIRAELPVHTPPIANDGAEV